MCGRTLLHLRRNVVAYLALFIALGGTSYAAVKLPANSVASKQIKKNAVTGAKIKKNSIASTHIKNNAVTSAKVKDGTLVIKDFAPNTLSSLRVAAAGGTGGNGGAGVPGARGATGDAGSAGATGATGATGPAGPSGVADIIVRTQQSAAASATANCPADYRAVGGGGMSASSNVMTESIPVDVNGPLTNDEIPTGWRVTLLGSSNTTAYVLCAGAPA